MLLSRVRLSFFCAEKVFKEYLVMPGAYCCVKDCKSRRLLGGQKNNGVRFFCFPKWKRLHGEQIAELTRRRRMAWVAAVRRKDITFDHIPQSHRVCSLHFHSGKLSYIAVVSNNQNVYLALLLCPVDTNTCLPCSTRLFFVFKLFM